MPDKEAHQEWGRLGSVSVRMIRKGFKVPPTAAIGLSQIQEWLETLPSFARAIVEWRRWGDVESSFALLRDEILSSPLPDDWTLVCETFRKRLCGLEGGDQDWPLILRPTFKRPQYEPESLRAVVALSSSSEDVWSAFKELFSNIFTSAMAREILLAGTDPQDLRIAVVVQPELRAENSAPLSVEASLDLDQKRKIAARLLKMPPKLDTVWDGEQLWYLDARDLARPKNIENRRVKHLLVDLDGTLLGARQVPLQLKFVGSFLKDVKQHGGWLNAIRALNSMKDELKKPSTELMNSERAVKKFAEVIGKPVGVAQDLLQNSISRLFPQLEKYFFPVPGARDFLVWARTRFSMTLATNPVWSEEIILLRLKWAGIEPSIFNSVTHNGRMKACKPAPEYYEDVLKQEGFQASEVLLVGDDWKNDLSASEVGIPVFILSKRFSLRAIDSSHRGAPAWQGSYPMLQSILKILNSEIQNLPKVSAL